MSPDVATKPSTLEAEPSVAFKVKCRFKGCPEHAGDHEALVPVFQKVTWA